MEGHKENGKPEANTGDDMGGAESDLLDLREILLWVTVQDELPNLFERHKFFGPQLSGVQNVELEVVFLRLRDSLNTELPLSGTTAFDGLEEILAVKV